MKGRKDLIFVFYNHLVGGQPYAGAVEGGDEYDALEGSTVLVAHRGVENFAFSLLEYHNLRFMVLVLGPIGAWILPTETWVP